MNKIAPNGKMQNISPTKYIRIPLWYLGKKNTVSNEVSVGAATVMVL